MWYISLMKPELQKEKIGIGAGIGIGIGAGEHIPIFLQRWLQPDSWGAAA